MLLSTWESHSSWVEASVTAVQAEKVTNVMAGSGDKSNQGSVCVVCVKKENAHGRLGEKRNQTRRKKETNPLGKKKPTP